MNEWQLMHILSQVRQLEAQAQRDPRAITHLIRIDEDIRGLPPSSRNSPVYLQLQGNLGNVFSRLLTGDRGANLRRAIACYKEALRFLTSDVAPLDYARTQNNLGEAYRQFIHRGPSC